MKHKRQGEVGKTWVYKNKLFIVSLIAVIAFVVPTTWALLTIVMDPLSNVFTVADMQPEIEEPGVDPGDVEWGATSKPVRLKNDVAVTQGAEAVVRAAFAVEFVDKATGNTLAIPVGPMHEPTDGTMVLGDITLHFDAAWSGTWFYKNDYFYYKSVLAPDASTSLLLSGVTLTNDTPEMRAKYADVDVQIKVLADILQARGGAPEEVWNITVNGNTVEP